MAEPVHGLDSGPCTASAQASTGPRIGPHTAPAWPRASDLACRAMLSGPRGSPQVQICGSKGVAIKAGPVPRHQIFGPLGSPAGQMIWLCELYLSCGPGIGHPCSKYSSRNKSASAAQCLMYDSNQNTANTRKSGQPSFTQQKP